ncbi:MAG TPA: RNA 2',3'-cyclic phosphodiesterase [Candidatus Sulfotelmatobacter sp.]|jgi:2'-5' RNA ligase|nr:RNA 2',3'-cyclic phosphodiesterase [Candidatus Sulfotelmatobacter sp.]
MIRLFAAIPLPKEVRRRLSQLTGGLPGARWSPPENLHVTLRFAGEVDEPRAEMFHDCLTAVAAGPFDLRIRGLGAFSSGHRAHTLWAGVDASDDLTHLQARVEAAARLAGLEPEGRKYTPHVTLARLARDTSPARLAEVISGNNLLAVTMPVDRFTLFASHLGKQEPFYEPLAEYPLGK